MLKAIKIFPEKTTFDFLGKRKIAFNFSGLLMVISIVSVLVMGLNFGIDFAGGLLIEVKTEGQADIKAMRKTLSSLKLGDVSLQGIGENGDEVMIRVQRQDGEEGKQMEALNSIKKALGDGVIYRKTEMVGPKVGGELIQDGILAVVFAILAICVYIWFRFEWQFALGAMIALVHDVIATVGIFSVLALDFNLTTIAAIMTIAGYSINDTVVSYDRVRENLRKYKKMKISDLLNLSINDMLSRTILTSCTTLVAVLSIFIFGGEVLRTFAFAMMWGIVIGTYSSMYVAMPFLEFFDLRYGTENTGQFENIGEKKET
ncbi:MAG: protein translocase subunit SecF [Alphaproteobacteria bacterium]|nr:protein translocase subunit SecF [Alphaproteobacteria bacterium]